ncbi:undecaprenyl-diphosphate phosphatase [Luteolibacter pohnpeiensis]|uniref:Undecaprenyl-diphosphatase n=1 Tax=Luteolibacter pohnpeiensis TaxID=454153 RepID=A0A934S917_9BACT|nr:undecaprenyl-diphosphate phosphatase [Luteolibacter pohnpeiensis]MBK1883081.1 undecaprenyl-diphosphate phosphatase [Luteolibacter pohnpeiensis]
MEPWQAFLLGIIEGITEYLPVSSTGHLVVAQRLMGIGTVDSLDKMAADAFAICIQGGAILAVLGLYYKRVLQMIMGVLGKDPEGLKLAIAIIAGFIPAAILGMLFNDWIEEKLFSLWPIIFALIVGGAAILGTSWWRKKHPAVGGGKDLIDLTWKMAVIIGLMQCVAMWPGTSRSLMTIVGGVLVGLSLRAAVEYSFLLGVLTLTAATVKKAVWKVDGFGGQYDTLFGGTKLMWEHYGTVPLLIGIVAAAVSAAIAVKWLVSYLQSHGLTLFGWYRIAIGLLIGGLVASGVFSA